MFSWSSDHLSSVYLALPFIQVRFQKPFCLIFFISPRSVPWLKTSLPLNLISLTWAPAVVDLECHLGPAGPRFLAS